MQSTNQAPPERMTPDQRRGEIAGLLALGLVRLREHNARKSAGLDPEGGLDLGFLGDQRVHSDPVNERTRKLR
ncbi:MAG: hypothetical protein ACREA0_15240 [bacterium]